MTATGPWRAPLTGESQRGQAIVEVTVMVVVLLMLVLGIVDFAPALVGAAQATQAARAGVDYGHFSWTDTAGIRARVKLAAPSLNLADGAITVTCYSGTTTTVLDCTSAHVGDTIKVQVTYVYQPITRFFAGIMGSTITINRSMTSGIY
jgi:Flp pilus assembly protein TadG